MKKHILTFCIALCALTASADEVMTKTADGTYIVNTTTLCKARGFRAETPVEVHIKAGKVVKVVALKNQETPTIFSRIRKNLLPLYDNMKISKATKQTEIAKVDGCTGATLSLKAVQKNIKSAIDYYHKNK